MDNVCASSFVSDLVKNATETNAMIKTAFGRWFVKLLRNFRVVKRFKDGRQSTEGCPHPETMIFGFRIFGWWKNTLHIHLIWPHVIIFLFPRLKCALKWKRFKEVQEIKAVAAAERKALTLEQFQKTFEKMARSLGPPHVSSLEESMLKQMSLSNVQL